MVGRLGGDEFLVVCETVPSPEAAFQIAVRSAASAAAAGDAAARDMRITPRASVGVAWSRGDEDADALVARADAAMYQSKTVGDGRPVLAPILRAVSSKHGECRRASGHGRSTVIAAGASAKRAAVSVADMPQ
jgi:GGDEF domain-containing protein